MKQEHYYDSKHNKDKVLEMNLDLLTPEGKPIIVEITVEEYEKKTGKKVKEGKQ
jgi:hypothetical protein